MDATHEELWVLLLLLLLLQEPADVLVVEGVGRRSEQRIPRLPVGAAHLHRALREHHHLPCRLPERVRPVHIVAACRVVSCVCRVSRVVCRVVCVFFIDYILHGLP
jgi:hypothetical protein